MLHTINIIHVLFNLSVIFVIAKCFGEIALFCGQSEIIGEIVAGILIGPNVLNLLYDTPMLLIMAEIGSIILLFDVGLSINIKNFVKSSKFALLVAISGIIMPYILSYFVLINFNFKNINAIFTAAIFTATSIAVTARVLKDSNKLSTQEAEIVLGAAFIDDILGVIILTIISNIVIGNKISLYSINKILIKIILFFIFSFIFGLLIPKLYKCFRNMSQDYVILIITIAICFIFSILSAKVNLAPIVGAFVSGIMITQTDQIRKIQKDIKPIYAFFVPIFFVLMGTNIKLNIFNPFIMKNVKFFIMTISLFIAAFVGKLLSGFAILRTKLNKLIIGLSMVPRGEVGLIFASIGLQYHIFDVNYYSVLITVIMLLTIITPILLKYILTKK